MFEVTIEALPSYRYRVDFDFPMIADAFKTWFSYEYSERIKDYKNGGKVTWEKGTATHYLEDDGDSAVIIRRGHIAWVDYWLTKGPGKNMAITYDRDSYTTAEKPFLRYPDGDPRSPAINMRWLMRFCGHPRGEFYVEAQIAGFNALMRHAQASINLGTGLGKSEIILAARSHLVGLEGPPAATGRGLILIPGESVKRELQLRAERWEEPPLPVNDWSDGNKVNLINAVGFMNSYEKDKSEVIKWLSEVEWVITDEAHKLSSASAVAFFDTLLPNLQRSMAVSGSLDKQEGLILNPAKTPTSRMGHDASLVVGLSGATFVDRKVEVNTDLTVYTAQVTDPREYDIMMLPETEHGREVPWLTKLDALINSERLPFFVEHVYRRDLVPDSSSSAKLYIPFASTESGSNLEQGLVARGFNVCYWSSGIVRLNGELVGTTLDKVKELSAENAYQILLTSKVSYEGIDLPGIDGVMPLLGSNWAMIAQPIGRAARGKKLRVYMLRDTGNDYIANATLKRRDKVMEEYEIKKYQTKEWEYQR